MDMQQWQDWVDLSFASGCDPIQIRDALVGHQLTLQSIQKLMGDKFIIDPYDSASKGHYYMPPDMYKALSEIRITKPAVPALHGPSSIQRIETDLAQIYLLENFLTDDQCVALCDIARAQVPVRSVVAGGPETQYIRTSSTCGLEAEEHHLVKEVDHRIANAMGLNPSYAQTTEAQIYQPGQEFKRHIDTFAPFTPIYDAHISSVGNRTWTFMVYLQCATKGGGTAFTEIGREFTPKRGTAIIWNNLTVDGIPNHATLHAGLPVEEGEKIIITKWFRERGTGLMFMDPITG